MKREARSGMRSAWLRGGQEHFVLCAICKRGEPCPAPIALEYLSSSPGNHMSQLSRASRVASSPRRCWCSGRSRVSLVAARMAQCCFRPQLARTAGTRMGAPLARAQAARARVEVTAPRSRATGGPMQHSMPRRPKAVLDLMKSATREGWLRRFERDASHLSFVSVQTTGALHTSLDASRSCRPM